MNNESIQNMDPNILVSIINMKLRDYYSGINELCLDMNLDKEILKKILLKENFEYIEEINQFK